jgi:1,4-dihydroxy-2-naphthoate octaprenyltransferase
MNYKIWISAMRLRTLPLAMASIILANFLAAANGIFNTFAAAFCMLTAVLLQILSNLANDYGDHQNGADNAARLGPMRAVQSGEIAPKTMKKAIILMAILSFCSGFALIYRLFAHIGWVQAALLLGVGGLCIAAALSYTAGKNPYGYAGWGDAAVFVFFGLIAVCGTYYLHNFDVNIWLLLPAVGVGLLSVAVLNLNNMRDIENDKNAGKFTIVVRIGTPKAKVYHWCLVVVAWVLLLGYALIYFDNWYQFAFLLLFFGFMRDLIKINAIYQNKDFDPYLKPTAMRTFALCVAYGVCSLL